MTGVQTCALPIFVLLFCEFFHHFKTWGYRKCRCAHRNFLSCFCCFAVFCISSWMWCFQVESKLCSSWYSIWTEITNHLSHISHRNQEITTRPTISLLICCCSNCLNTSELTGWSLGFVHLSLLPIKALRGFLYILHSISASLTTASIK